MARYDDGGYGDKEKYDSYLDYLNRFRKQKQTPIKTPPKKPATGNLGYTPPKQPASGQLGNANNPSAYGSLGNGMSQQEYNKWAQRGYAPSAWKNGNVWQREAARRIAEATRYARMVEDGEIIAQRNAVGGLGNQKAAGHLGNADESRFSKFFTGNMGVDRLPQVGGFNNMDLDKNQMPVYGSPGWTRQFMQEPAAQAQVPVNYQPFVPGTYEDSRPVFLPEPDTLPQQTDPNLQDAYPEYGPWVDLNLRGGGGYGGGGYGYGGYGGGGNYNVNYNNNYRGGTGTRANDINTWYANMVNWNVNRPKGG